MQTNINCRFCNIEEQQNQRIISVRDTVVVILSNPRLMSGHLLVIPKRHVLGLSELTTEEQKELFDTVIEFQEKILKNVASGCDIRQNNRSFQAESDLKVHHVHVHLQPRELEDELYQSSQIYERNIFKPLAPEEVEKYRKLFSN